MTLIIMTLNNLKCFLEKFKVGLHKSNFSPAMHDWGVFLNSKKVSIQIKGVLLKLIYSIKANMIISFFSRFLVKFFRNIIK